MPEYTSARIRKATKQKITQYAKKYNIASITQPWKLASDDEIINLWHSKTVLFDEDEPLELTGSDKPFTIDLNKFQELAGEIRELTEQELTEKR